MDFKSLSVPGELTIGDFSNNVRLTYFRYQISYSIQLLTHLRSVTLTSNHEWKANPDVKYQWFGRQMKQIKND